MENDYFFSCDDEDNNNSNNSNNNHNFPSIDKIKDELEKFYGLNTIKIYYCKDLINL